MKQWIILPLLALMMTLCPAIAATGKTKGRSAVAAQKQAPAVISVSNLGVLATVNDEAISSLDLDNRIALVLATTGLSDTAETREKLRTQLLRTLISETLQKQEVTRSGIAVTAEDIQQAIGSIEQQRNMPQGSLEAQLVGKGLDSSIFLNQLKIQIGWNKLIVKKLRPNIKVSEEEIDRSRNLVSHNNQVSEVRIAILSLPVDKPEREAQVKKLAEKLSSEIQQGVSFENIAPQLSSNATVQRLEPFWIAPAQLDKAVLEALKSTKPGAITKPVRTADGYSILKLYDVKRISEDSQPVELRIKDILLKIKASASSKDGDLMLQIGQQVALHPGSCEEKSVASIADKGDLDIDVAYRDATAEELPEGIASLIAPLKVGEISQPVATSEGIRLFMLCGRNRMPLDVAEREKVYNMLSQQKLMLEAQKYLRNLQRDAYVDIRI